MHSYILYEIGLSEKFTGYLIETYCFTYITNNITNYCYIFSKTNRKSNFLYINYSNTIHMFRPYRVNFINLDYNF